MPIRARAAQRGQVQSIDSIGSATTARPRWSRIITAAATSEHIVTTASADMSSITPLVRMMVS